MRTHLQLEHGSTLVFTVGALGFVALIGMFVVHIIELETKMVQHYINSEQAFQIASAGVEVAIADSFELLNESYTYQEQFPQFINIPKFTMLDNIEDNSILTVSRLNKNQQNATHLHYTFTSNGNYKGAKKTLEIEVCYSYSNYYVYIYGEDGTLQSKTFVYRTFNNRGKITAFKIIN